MKKVKLNNNYEFVEDGFFKMLTLVIGLHTVYKFEKKYPNVKTSQLEGLTFKYCEENWKEKKEYYKKEHQQYELFLENFSKSSYVE